MILFDMTGHAGSIDLWWWRWRDGSIITQYWYDTAIDYDARFDIVCDWPVMVVFDDVFDVTTSEEIRLTVFCLSVLLNYCRWRSLFYYWHYATDGVDCITMTWYCDDWPWLFDLLSVILLTVVLLRRLLCPWYEETNKPIIIGEPYDRMAVLLLFIQWCVWLSNGSSDYSGVLLIERKNVED